MSTSAVDKNGRELDAPAAPVVTGRTVSPIPARSASAPSP